MAKRLWPTKLEFKKSEARFREKRDELGGRGRGS
jgi:hypothetical protein